MVTGEKLYLLPRKINKNNRNLICYNHNFSQVNSEMIQSRKRASHAILLNHDLYCGSLGQNAGLVMHNCGLEFHKN